MYPVKGALESAGQCSIPVTLVVLGAYFYKEKDTSNEIKDVIPTRMEGVEEAGVVSNGDDVDSRCRCEAPSPSALDHCRDLFTKLNPKKGGFFRSGAEEGGDKPLLRETRTVWITVLSRMVLTPLLLIPLMAFAAKNDWHSVFEEWVLITLLYHWIHLMLTFFSPVFVVSNVLLVASPPALTLAQVSLQTTNNLHH